LISPVHFRLCRSARQAGRRTHTRLWSNRDECGSRLGPGRRSMPAADNTQAQTNPAQQASTGTTMPDDPTALLFQAPDYSKVPVRRRQPAKQDDQDNEDRGRGRNKNQRNPKRNGQRHDSNDKSSREPKSGDEQQDVEQHSSRGTQEEEQHNDDQATVSQRRRRRRRGNVDLEMDGGGDGDPEQTVTRVRAPRQASTSGPDEVTSLRGSTRLEAKRQRRRTSRRGRRKNTVVSEAEFLARRESVERKMMVRQHDNRIQ